MNQILRLALLGSPQILLGDQPLTGFATNKAQALLFYLAVTADSAAAHPAPRSRDVIATLLWGEMTETQAKQNLRTVLPELRRLVGNYLRIDRQTIAFDHTRSYWLDVEVLRRSLTPGPAPVDWVARQAAVDLYQGEFLSGFYINNAPDFEAWVQGQREQLHTLVVETLFGLVNEHMARSDFIAALTANRRLLLLEPWSEPVHRQQMLLLAQSGERSAALAQYEACRRVLVAEFGVEPLAETTALYEQIRVGEWGASAQSKAEKGQDLAPKTQSPEPAVASGGEENDHDAGLPTPVVGYNLPPRTKLYGRQPELARVHKWVGQDGCRLVGIFGIGGQGKSALAATLVRTLAEPAPQAGPGVRFQCIIWQSLLNAPPLAEVMQEWVYALSNQTVTSLPSSLDQQFSQLLGYLHGQRCLLILDNLESILQSDGHSGAYRPSYEAYGQLMRHLAEGEHQSCLLLTSRERPHDLAHLEEDTPTVRFLSLTGLPADAGRQMLTARGVAGDTAMLADLVQHYSGNPLALKLVGETVQDIFDGNIAAFLQADTLVFDDIRYVLDQQFARLAPLEREIMLWLALVREPVVFNALRDLLAQPPAPRLVLEAMRSLQRRSLLEKYDEGFGLQNVVLEYTTDLLVDNIGRELLDDKMTVDYPATLSPHSAELTSKPHPLTSSHLNRYALLLAQVKEYVRASQTRLLLQPIAERLLTRLGSSGAEQQLQRRLVHLHTMPPSPGYAAANLLHLLLQLGVDLRAYDFSRLYLRQLYLRGVSLPQTNFAQAEMVDSVFTEPFGLVYTTVFSPDGHYLAVGTSEGAIYLWRTADQQLAQVIQAHNQAIKELAFAQRTTSEGVKQLVLASASDDKSVGFWVIDGEPQARWHVQLVHEQQESVISVGFSPDGHQLTSVDGAGRVFMWDVHTLAEARLLHSFATTPTRWGLVAYSGDGQTIAVGNREGAVQLRQLATGAVDLEVAAETGPITALALSEDGRTLVTGGRKGHLCFWRVPEGQLQQLIETKGVAIDDLAFSVDGQWLATTHGVGDHVVRLWAVDAQARWRLYHTLLGHTHTIWSVAFRSMPSAMNAGSHQRGPQRLVTGSSDQTVRVWDAETGQSLYTLRGQPRALSAIAVHALAQLAAAPGAQQAQEWLLATVGYDHLVRLWTGRNAQADQPAQILRGARQALYTVAISPDGRLVAGAGHDNLVYLWDLATGHLRQIFQGHTNSVYCIAFHPRGELLASGSTDSTVRIWSLDAGEQERPRAMGDLISDHSVALLPANPHLVYDLAFRPDGRVLATVGAERVLRLWDMTERHYPELVAARKTVEGEGVQDIQTVAFSPDGAKLACGGAHLIYLWDLSDDPIEKAHSAQSAVGTEIVQSCEHAASHGAAPLILRQHTAWILTLAFSPDGATLASGGNDCTVCLWDVASGALRATLHGHNEVIHKVAFTPDGATLLSCGFDGAIIFWDVQTGECLNTLRVEGPYAEMNITDVTGITEAQKAALKALGAVESTGGHELAGVTR